MSKRNLNHSLAVTFCKRADALGLRGRKADLAALEFFCGACAAAELLGDKEAFDQISFGVFIVSVRGFKEIEKWADAEPETEAA